MTVLVNFLGQPGSGKSTLGTSLFTELKTRDCSTEFIPEYIKAATYLGEKITKYSQYTIFGVEAKNQSQLFNKVDYIIADSPLYLCAFYQHYYWNSETLLEPCKEFYNLAEEDGVKTINIFIDRKFKYNPKGRFQDEKQSDEVKEDLLSWLAKNNFPYIYLKCPVKQRVNEILSILGISERNEEVNGNL